MKLNLRHIVAGAVAALILAGLLMLAGCGSAQRSKVLCNALDVQIKDAWEFVTPEDIRGFLDRNYGVYIGVRLDSLDLAGIERMLENKSIVMKSEAWTTRDGILHIEISQREPIVRFQNGSYGFYADDRGFIFPLQSNYTSLVPVIDGNLPLKVEEEFKGEPSGEREKDWIAGVLEMVRFMQRSRTWAENIVQIHADSRGDLVLVPREGQERFIFGYPSDIPAKFTRMEEYYRYIKPSKPEGFYTSVNVKYNGQVICREK